MLEVRAADRPGRLYLVCSALADLDITVRSAHVDTLGPQAVDVFYVQEADAGALSDQPGRRRRARRPRGAATRRLTTGVLTARDRMLR